MVDEGSGRIGSIKAATHPNLDTYLEKLKRAARDKLVATPPSPTTHTNLLFAPPLNVFLCNSPFANVKQRVRKLKNEIIRSISFLSLCNNNKQPNQLRLVKNIKIDKNSRLVACFILSRSLCLKETAVAAILPFIDLIEELVGTPTNDRYPWRLFIDDVSALK